jgi:ATP adenylyltransferase
MKNFPPIKQGCIFCNLPEDDGSRILAENELAYAIRDGFAVTEGHTLIIPKRHVIDYFGLTQPELNAVNQLLSSEKKKLQKTDPSIAGFNIGMNCGEASGQTIFHCHIHLIPRRVGDVENPRGGVRHVIPGKGHYKA